MSTFIEISSIESKFATPSKFYKDFLKLKNRKSRNKETNQKKISALGNASLLYNELISIHKKEHNQTFESKDRNWQLKHDYKNQKDLNYQPDQPQEPDQPK